MHPDDETTTNSSPQQPYEIRMSSEVDIIQKALNGKTPF